VIAGKRHDGTLDIINYEFVSGAPYYLRYELHNVKKDYFNEFGNEINRITYSGKGNMFVCEKNTFNLDKFYFEDSFACKDYEFVAIMSDGVLSFQQMTTTLTTKRNLPLDLIFVLNEILSFKGCFGEFVQRRSQKVLKEFKKSEIHHYDDFSIGVISAK
jgi:hypothetical protein